jgi:hypothetical protein
MPMRIGLLAYPAFFIVLQIAKPSAVPAFEAVNAYTPETSRRPQSLEVKQKALRKAVKKKLLVPVGDGRYYLDRAAVKRRDRANLVLMGIVALTAIPVAFMVL